MAYYDRSYSIMELEVLHMIGSSHICVIYNIMLDLITVIQANWM